MLGKINNDTDINNNIYIKSKFTVILFISLINIIQSYFNIAALLQLLWTTIYDKIKFGRQRQVINA